jgi:hypothetical protein
MMKIEARLSTPTRAEVTLGEGNVDRLEDVSGVFSENLLPVLAQVLAMRQDLEVELIVVSVKMRSRE